MAAIESGSLKVKISSISSMLRFLDLKSWYYFKLLARFVEDRCEPGNCWLSCTRESNLLAVVWLWLNWLVKETGEEPSF